MSIFEAPNGSHTTAGGGGKALLALGLGGGGPAFPELPVRDDSTRLRVGDHKSQAYVLDMLARAVPSF